MSANEKLVKKLQELESRMRKENATRVEFTLNQSELAAVIAALAVQDLDEDLRRAGLSD